MKLRGGRWIEMQRRIRENEEGRGMRGRETAVCYLIVWKMELFHMGLHLLTITIFVRLLWAVPVSWEVVPLVQEPPPQKSPRTCIEDDDIDVDTY